MPDATPTLVPPENTGRAASSKNAPEPVETAKIPPLTVMLVREPDATCVPPLKTCRMALVPFVPLLPLLPLLPFDPAGPVDPVGPCGPVLPVAP